MTSNKPPPEQTSMFDVFDATEFERKTSHLPNSVNGAAEHLRGLFVRLHAAILSGDDVKFESLQSEANQLARRLNGGTRFGMKAGDDSLCNLLERLTAAQVGTIPEWGQAGEFEVAVRGCRVRIECDGVYGISFPAFSANAVCWDRPFLSPTGYRSFLQHRTSLMSGRNVLEYVAAVIEEHIAIELRGRLVSIERRYLPAASLEHGPSPDA